MTIAGIYMQKLFSTIVKSKSICKRRKFTMISNSQLDLYFCDHHDGSTIKNSRLICSDKEHKADKENFLLKSKESKENIHAHSLLLSLPHYYKTTVDCQLLGHQEHKVSLATQKEELKLFSNILYEFSSIDTLFYDSKDRKGFSEGDRKKLLNMQKTISDEGLLKILLFSISPVLADSDLFVNYFDLFKVLRKVSTKRLHLWTNDQILLLADIWYLLKYDNTYIHTAVKILGSRLSYLSLSQLVQFFFYLNIIRDNKVPQCFDPYLNNSLDKINIQELGIICMGLFKTKTSVNDSHVFEKIVKKLITNCSSVPDFTLNAILKFVRFNFSKSRQNQKNIELYLNLLNELKSHMHRFNTYSLVQIASLGNSSCIYDENCLQEVYNILFPLLPEVRIKDIERLTYVIMNSRMYPKNYPFYSKLIEYEIMDVRRSEEIRLHLHSFLSCVYYLACIDLKLSTELISKTLKLADSTGVLKDNCHQDKASSYKRKLQLCQLERIATLDEHRSYEGYRIPKEFIRTEIKKHLPRMPNKCINNLNSQESSLLMIMDLMEKLKFDDKKMMLSYILPHIPFIGIVFCTNTKGKPMNIPESFYSYSQEEIKYPVNSQDFTWNTIIFATKASYLCNSFILRGDFMVKIIQLQKIGYNVIIISFHDLFPSLEAQRLQNLCNALADSSSLSLPS